jgi:hypothetical protein
VPTGACAGLSWRDLIRIILLGVVIVVIVIVVVVVIFIFLVLFILFIILLVVIEFALLGRMLA